MFEQPDSRKVVPIMRWARRDACIMCVWYQDALFSHDRSVNDPESPMPAFENDVRRPFERLLRKLLKFPNRPAVVLMHAYVWAKV